MSKRITDFANECSSLSLSSTSFHKGNAMNTRTRSVLNLVAAAMVTLAFTATSANGAMIYSEDFELINLGDADVLDGGAAGVFTGSTWPNTDFVLSGAVNLLKPAGGSAWLSPVPAALDTTFAALHSGVTATVDLSDTFDANTTYTLTFTQFRRDDIAGDEVTAKILTTGGTELASQTFATVAATDTFLTRTLVFDTADNAAGNGQAIRLQLIDSSGGTVTPQAMVDNISLDASANPTAPEPSTAVLAGLALAGLALGRGRRQSR